MGRGGSEALRRVKRFSLLANPPSLLEVVLHQPSWQLFQLFDDVLLLGKGGSTVYLGPSGSAGQYFSEVSGVLSNARERRERAMLGSEARGRCEGTKRGM